jgi:hypothetical protein
MSYDNWRKRLEIAQQHPTVAARRAAVSALKINFSQPGEADEGYYRKPVTIKDPKGNGHNIVTGWIPVALYMWEGKLTGQIGDYEQSRDMTDREIGDEELWSYVVSHPIPYEWYQAVVERNEPWPDMKPVAVAEAPEAIPAANRDVARSDNNPPEVLPEVEHATAIDNAIAAAPKIVTNETEAAQALGSKNRIAELRLAADKAGKALYQPIYAEYKRLHGIWTPPVARAETAEKKINVAILTFRENERKRIAKEQAEVAARQRLIDEENERAAQRAIAAGRPEPEPVVIEEAPPAPPAPAPVVPTYGTRKLTENVKWHLDAITDYDAVYHHFKEATPLKVVLLTLATAAVKAGRTVPGTKTHEGLA